MQSAFLGFIVVKPLPESIIGRTCLKVYDDDNGRRCYPVKRKYRVHLLGLDLMVESLAFQEQDRVAAACATSALWSTFHGTGVLFQHSIPSPVEITQCATEQTVAFERDFPNTGLYPVQMAAAIKSVGLEPEWFRVKTAHHLQAIAYAYLKARIPFVMNSELYDLSNKKETAIGGHAVAVAGYSLGHQKCKPWPEPRIDTLLTSSKIDKLYVHDDGIGPFARLTFAGEPLEFTDPKSEPRLQMHSSWRGRDDCKGSVVFAPEAIILPLYHKIRIRFDTILKEVQRCDVAMRRLHILVPNFAPAPLEWDVFLTNVSDLKADLPTGPPLLNRQLYALLEKPMPRFIWRARGLLEGTPVLDLLFDATDIEQGRFLLETIIYEQNLKELLDYYWEDAAFRDLLRQDEDLRLVETWFPRAS